jgi:hypothetical protein
MNPFKSLAPHAPTLSLAACAILAGRDTTPITRLIICDWILRPASGSTTGFAAVAAWEFLRKPRSAFLCWLNSRRLKSGSAKTPEKQGFALILVSYEAARLDY